MPRRATSRRHAEPAPTLRVFVATAPCDLRKQFDGIAMVEQSLRHDPRSGHLFVVFNRRGDQMRILFWDRQGYCLFAKRLLCGAAHNQ
jgi:transposase